jgi:hypothetical protein
MTDRTDEVAPLVRGKPNSVFVRIRQSMLAGLNLMNDLSAIRRAKRPTVADGDRSVVAKLRQPAANGLHGKAEVVADVRPVHRPFGPLSWQVRQGHWRPQRHRALN